MFGIATHQCLATMNRAIRILAAGVLAVLPTRVAAQQTAKDSVLAVVNEFFRAMAARDTAAFARTQMSDGVMYAVVMRADSAAIRRQTIEALVRQVGATTDTYLERMWDATVHVHGPIAVVWTPYDLHRNGQFSHYVATS